jgi:hypothetical protein
LPRIFFPATFEVRFQSLRSRQRNIKLAQAMKVFHFFLCFVTFVAARDVKVKDQVFCAIDQLVDLVDKQESILESLIEIYEDSSNSDYFSR